MPVDHIKLNIHYMFPQKPISSHAQNNVWAKYIGAVNACSYTMAIYQFYLAYSEKEVLSGAVSRAALSFKPKDRCVEELTFLPL